MPGKEPQKLVWVKFASFLNTGCSCVYWEVDSEPEVTCRTSLGIALQTNNHGSEWRKEKGEREEGGKGRENELGVRVKGWDRKEAELRGK